jgi:septal ring factor EnvC (AmiA/AmiB activator)
MALQEVSIILSIVMPLITLAGVWGALKYWQGKTDERLKQGTENFTRVDKKFTQVDTALTIIANNCKAENNHMSTIERNIGVLETKVESHDKRLDVIESKS